MIQDWYTVTWEALQNLWAGFLGFIPALLGAIIIFVIGWFIALIIGKLVTKVLDLLKINQLFSRGNWDEAMEKAGIKANVTGFIGTIVKWILMLVFLIAATEVLGLAQFAKFLNQVLAYLPNVLIAALIFVATVIVVEIVEKVISASLHKMSPASTNMVGIVVKWAIWIFALLAILMQLGIATDLVTLLVQGFVGVLVIAGGLAFGLGGKDVAAEILQDLRKKMKG